METSKELNTKIVALTTMIKEKYTELYEHLSEMPVTNPDETHPDINRSKLQEYYDLLQSMLTKYAHDHPTSFDVG